MSSPEERSEPRYRGLPAIQTAQENRASGKSRWPSPRFWAYSAVVLAIGAILRWKYTEGEMESERQKLLAMQRDVASSELGKRWVPFRDRVERWTLELAKSAEPEVIDRAALRGWDFRDKPGVYLRLHLGEAQSAEAIRKGASNSLRDGFVSCLVRVPNPDPMAGRECKRTRDCPKGEFCNFADHCSVAAQPFNLRDAYRTMFVLSDAWLREVQEAQSDLRVRLYKEDFDAKFLDDFPRAAELLQRAQYFMVVLDEGVPSAPAPAPDAGVSVEEALQTVAHPARVGVWRLADDTLVLRVRREAGGQLLGVQPNVDAEVLDARQRQANNCALALAVREAMGDTNAAAAPPAP